MKKIVSPLQASPRPKKKKRRTKMREWESQSHVRAKSYFV
jgi:hypothetical protein